jgi:hypothetical protein
MAFFLLSGPDPGPEPGMCAQQAAVAREGKPARTRVRHLPRSRLLYFAAVLALYPGSRIRISHLTCGAKGTRTPDPLLCKAQPKCPALKGHTSQLWLGQPMWRRAVLLH